MNKTVGLIFLLIALRSAEAQTELIRHEWNVTLRVVDEAGQPISGAKASVGYFANSKPASIGGLTDTNGIFKASHSAFSGILGFTAEKSGFYASKEPSYELGFTYDAAIWNPDRTIVLRNIGNPIPMYSKRQEIKFPKLDEPVGFDLMVGDWVLPYGRGVHIDMFFTAHRQIINDRDFSANLTVTFPNKGDGIITAPAEPAVGSVFKTSRTTVEIGYKPQLVLNYSSSKRPEPVFGYFIRVRTILDADGNVKSTLYGKISRDFRFYAGTITPTSGMGFDYYLNPTPNDRNVEFDPKQNLIKNLSPLEEVRGP